MRTEYNSFELLIIYSLLDWHLSKCILTDRLSYAFNYLFEQVLKKSSFFGVPPPQAIKNSNKLNDCIFLKYTPAKLHIREPIESIFEGLKYVISWGVLVVLMLHSFVARNDEKLAHESTKIFHPAANQAYGKKIKMRSDHLGLLRRIFFSLFIRDW